MDLDEEGQDKDLDDYEWKCKLLEYIQQYPDVFDLARHKNKHFREQTYSEGRFSPFWGRHVAPYTLDISMKCRPFVPEV